MDGFRSFQFPIKKGNPEGLPLAKILLNNTTPHILSERAIGNGNAPKIATHNPKSEGGVSANFQNFCSRLVATGIKESQKNPNRPKNDHP